MLDGHDMAIVQMYTSTALASIHS